METRSNHILVGAVVMGDLVALLLFIVWLSNAGGDQDRKYDILFRQAVDGLAKGSAVTFSGVAVGQVLESAPELLNRVSTLTARLTELLGDRNQASIAAILENVQVISRNLAERSDEIAATLAEARIAIRQTGDAVEKMGRLAATSNDVLDRDARPMLADLRQTVRAAETSMRNLDAVVSDARPGVQAFSKQTIPEVGQLVRD